MELSMSDTIFLNFQNFIWLFLNISFCMMKFFIYHSYWLLFTRHYKIIMIVILKSLLENGNILIIYQSGFVDCFSSWKWDLVFHSVVCSQILTKCHYCRRMIKSMVSRVNLAKAPRYFIRPLEWAIEPRVCNWARLL